MKGARGEDSRTQAAAEFSFQEVLATGGDDAIHPVARFAFLGALEFDVLETEAFPDPLREVGTLDDEVPPEDRGRELGELEVEADFLDDFAGEKRDLALVVWAVGEVAVTAQARSGDALHLFDRDDAVLQPALALFSPVVVTGGDVDGEEAGVEVGWGGGVRVWGGHPGEGFGFSCANRRQECDRKVAGKSRGSNGEAQRRGSRDVSGPQLKQEIRPVETGWPLLGTAILLVLQFRFCRFEGRLW